MAGIFQEKIAKLLFLVFFIFEAQAFAANHSLEIKRENRYSPTRIDRVKIVKDTVYLNNKTSKNKVALQKAQNLLAIKNIPQNSPCYAGKVTLTTFDGNRKSQRWGCATGREFGQLLQNLYALHRSIDGEKRK